MKDKLRALVRETAQPVAVVTPFMQPDSSSTSHTLQCTWRDLVHSDGPIPLFAFALRMPSRIASSLDAAQPDQASHMVVNLLSVEKASISVKFSRSDLYPELFSSIPCLLSEEALPTINDSLGTISYKLVSMALPLHDLGLLKGKSTEEMMKPPLEDCPCSKLFIAHGRGSGPGTERADSLRVRRSLGWARR